MMPPQDRVRRHDGCHSIECFPAEALSFRGESPSLLVGQSEPTALHLLLQDTILFDQVIDNILLVAVHPA